MITAARSGRVRFPEMIRRAGNSFLSRNLLLELVKKNENLSAILMSFNPLTLIYTTTFVWLSTELWGN
jgi:hypothetical protein